MATRNQQHFIIMTVIYNELTDFNYGDKQVNRTSEQLLEELCNCSIEQIPSFVKDSINLSLITYGEAKKAFEAKLMDWKWERIPLLSQAILIMSYTHFYKVEKIEKSIVISIAVELAKKYVEEKQAKFINGILENVLK